MNVRFKLFLSALFLIVVLGCSGYGRYAGMSVGDVLSSMNKPYTHYVFLHEPPCHLNGAEFYYENGQIVEIYVDDYRYLNRFDESCDWDIVLFKLETVSRVKQSGSEKRTPEGRGGA